ncbi:hypothetical protein, partial [Arthrobacter sp. NPDC093139]|uniref:hypothetical protein n=1 Tax=Arthrobacter sp. NPDC093139 TaxID=3363945 RepID=UPI0037F1A96A
HRGGQARQINQFIKNRYQQTWHTIEFSNNRHIRILLETITIEFAIYFVSHFFAAMFIAYFIHIHFANPGCFPEIHFVNRIRPALLEALLHFVLGT